MLGRNKPTNLDQSGPGRGFPDDDIFMPTGAGTFQTQPPPGYGLDLTPPGGNPGPMIPAPTTGAQPTMPNDTTTDTRSAGQKFLDDYERLGNELRAANTTIAQLKTELAVEATNHKNELTNAQLQIAMQKEQMANLNADKNRYLRYAVDLASQLQFVVAGSVRALKIAQSVSASLAAESGGEASVEVPGADVAELESIMQRMAANNPHPNDGENQPISPPSQQALN